MIHEILGLLIEFAVQTVFLSVALWIMIKLQKLDYNFPGLLGTAALASGLDRMLDTVVGHFLGDYLSAYISGPIVIVVLIICISKLTHADKVDVLFTIMVGYALMFGMNLWLFGALLGDLRPSARDAKESDLVALQSETNTIEQTASPTNQPAPTASGKLAAQPDRAQTGEKMNGFFSVIGIAQNGTNSAVTIQTGKRTYTISLGESALTQTKDGPVSVTFKEMGKGWVVLIINGQETKLPFH